MAAISRPRELPPPALAAPKSSSSRNSAIRNWGSIATPILSHPPIPSPSPSPSPFSVALRMNPRVLVVDDVAAMAEQYAYDLRRLGGYRTRSAASGKEALAALVEEEVDCVILDLEMPGIDGFEVLRLMREREIDVPVIVYTGTG